MMSDRKEIGIMMDEFGLYEHLSCCDNLKILADLHGIKRETIRDKLKDASISNWLITGNGLIVLFLFAWVYKKDGPGS